MFLEKVFTYSHKWRDYLNMIFLMIVMYAIVLWCMALVISLPQDRNVYGEYLSDPTSVGAYVSTLFACTPHIGVFVALAFFFKRIHKQSVLCLVSASNVVRWKRLFVGMGITLLVYALLQGLPILIHPEGVEFVFDPSEFIPYFLFLIPLVLVQVAVEELCFRSYLMQAVAIVAGRVIVPVIISAVLFAVMHIQTPNISSLGILLGVYLVSGLMYSVITILDGGIELSTGCHFVYNMMVFSVYDRGNNPALFQLNQAPEVGGYAIAIEVVVSLILLLLFSLIYHWDWRRLLQKIEKPESV